MLEAHFYCLAFPKTKRRGSSSSRPGAFLPRARREEHVETARLWAGPSSMGSVARLRCAHKGRPCPVPVVGALRAPLVLALLLPGGLVRLLRGRAFASRFHTGAVRLRLLRSGVPVSVPSTSARPHRPQGQGCVATEGILRYQVVAPPQQQVLGVAAAIPTGTQVGTRRTEVCGQWSSPGTS